MYSIILVHIGDQFFDYINDCIEQIIKFNNCDIYLIISNKHKNKITDNANIIEIESLPITEKHKLFNQNTTLDRNFRGGFWKFATERFFFIEDLMIYKNIQNVFHFENDVLIYRNISDFFEIFSEKYEMAATFDNDNRCIPGFMYLKNSDLISKLTKFILTVNGMNDMELIPMFNNYYKSFGNLPIIPSNYDKPLKSTSGLVTYKKEKYYENFHLFNSIFDAAALGQYLGGIDPRNAPSKPGFINESCLFNTSLLTFSWVRDTNNRKIPYATFNGKKYKINTLHIHSKKLELFLS